MRDLTRLDYLALAAVLLLALGLRMGFAGTNPYASDEARVSVLALEMARNGELAAAGISNSAGSRNLPASVYAFTPPYLLSSDPLVATQYVALLNVIAVGILWLFVRKHRTTLVATSAALILACAPFAVFFSRNIWTQNLLIPFTLLWVWLVDHALDGGKYRSAALVGAAFIAGFAFQVHLAGAALGLAMAYAFFRWRWWRHLLPILIGGMLALVSLLPFAYEAACCAPELVSEFLQSEGESAFDADALLLSVRVALNQGWDYLAAGDLAAHGDHPLPQILIGLLLLVGTISLIRTDRRVLELALLIALTPIALFTYHTTTVRLHYLLGVLPAVAIVAGYAVALINQQRIRLTLFVLTVALCGIWSVQALDSLQIASERATPNGINTPLSVPRSIARSVPDDRIPVMHTQSTDLVYRGEPAIWKTLFWNREHRVADGWSTLILPDEPAYLMTDYDGIHAIQEVAYAGLRDERFQLIQVLEGTQYFMVQPYDGAALPQPMIRLDEPVTFETGLRLIGWYARAAGQQMRISLVYEALSDPLPQADLRQFTHIRAVDAPDVQPLYYGDLPLTQAWQAGDHLITIAVVTPQESSGDYLVDIGHYALASGVRYAHDGGGDALRLGPFSWAQE